MEAKSSPSVVDDTGAKLWYIPYVQVKGSELENHIISDASQIVAVIADASNIR